MCSGLGLDRDAVRDLLRAALDRDAADAGAGLGESPLWLPEHGLLLWLDLTGRKVHLFDPERASAYAARTVVNLCHKRARRRRRWQRVREALQLDPARPRNPAEHHRDTVVRQAVEALPDDLRDVLLLTEFSGLKQREIAEILDIAPGTVASRRSRALKRLEECL